MVPTARHQAYFVPRDEVARRIEALQSALREQNLAVVWIDHLADRLYFTGSAQEGVLIVTPDEPPRFFVRKSRGRAEAESSLQVLAYPGGRELVGELRRVAGVQGRAGLAMDVTPAATYARLTGSVDPARLVDVARTVRRIRSVKSPWEIEQIRGASDQVTVLYAEIGEQIHRGMTELQLTARVEGRLRELGHSGTVRVRRPGSDITMGVVVSGASALYPTSFDGCVGAEGPYPNTASGAGWKRLSEGETLMLDIVTVHNGYHADTTRAFFVGSEISDEASRAHEFCRGVLREIEQRLSPGKICSEIYREVSASVERRDDRPQGFMGFGENRVRFFGHGVGLELDEMPVLADRIDVPLEVGMVLAIEPKAFVEGIGPVGVENTYVVTAEGYERFCKTDDALVSTG